jgi:hypothetical protein
MNMSEIGKDDEGIGLRSGGLNASKIMENDVFAMDRWGV